MSSWGEIKYLDKCIVYTLPRAGGSTPTYVDRIFGICFIHYLPLSAYLYLSNYYYSFPEIW